MTDLRRAAFLDRDGTLIEDLHYLADAGAMRLLPDVAEVVRGLNADGILAIVVTNQSGIAQGLISPEQYDRTRLRLEELLAQSGARLDGSYHCPHYPPISGACDCRKPGSGMHRLAARDLHVDLARSLYVGDRFRDVAPGLELGGLSILVPSPSTPADEIARAEREASVAPTLAAAVERFRAAHAVP
jgi:D-glycero-D-manno-heptose 1,7-bisphosphate phosphatase